MPPQLAKKRKTERTTSMTTTTTTTTKEPKSILKLTKKPDPVPTTDSEETETDDHPNISSPPPPQPPSTTLTKAASKPTESDEYDPVSSEDEADDDEEDVSTTPKPSKLQSAHDSSDSDLDLQDDDDEYADDAASDDSDDGLDDLLISQYENTSGASASLKRKRSTDPTVFSTTLQKLLGSHLTTKARVDPILVRSKARAEIITDTKLEAKAKRVLSLQKKAELEKGRVRDVIGVVSAGGSASREGSGQDARRTMEKERMLRKIAQRGVVRLFNAVRAAQIKGEEAQKEVKGSVIGMKNREEKVVEMSKKGFLDLIQSTATGKSSVTPVPSGGAGR